MRILGVAVVAMVVVGCGGGGDEDRLNGTWIAELGSTCGLGMTFDVGAKTYVEQTLCVFSDGTLGDELSGGGLDSSVSGQLGMTPRRASCPTSDHRPYGVSYAFQGSNGLSLGGDSGAVAYQRAPASTAGSAVVRFGCWTMTGFVAHPIQDL